MRGPGPVAKGVADGLYAVLVYLLVALALSRARAAVLGAIALGLCAVIELTQLTGISAAVVDLWRPARYVLGTTFQATDLVAYAAAVVVAAWVDRTWSTGRRGAQ